MADATARAPTPARPQPWLSSRCRSTGDAAAGSFVGRELELAALARPVGAGRRGQVAGASFLAGEPGIGKTRLAAEFAHHAHAEGGTVLFGRCDEDLDVPYQPFIEALRASPIRVRPGTLRAARPERRSELMRCSRAGRAAGTATPSSADPDTDRYRLLDAVSAWLATTTTSGR